VVLTHAFKRFTLMDRMIFIKYCNGLRGTLPGPKSAFFVSDATTQPVTFSIPSGPMSLCTLTLLNAKTFQSANLCRVNFCVFITLELSCVGIGCRVLVVPIFHCVVVLFTGLDMGLFSCKFVSARILQFINSKIY
jgi:hypothetical protein